LTLFQQGKVRDVGRRHLGGTVRAQRERLVRGRQRGFALAPDTGLGKRANWLWAWSLAIPSSSDAPEAAKTFLAWATGPGYATARGRVRGHRQRAARHEDLALRERRVPGRAPYAQMTIDSINAADPTNPTVDPVPYTGVQFVAIPEFQGIGTAVGEQFSAALAGQQTAEEALAAAQALTLDEMTAAGYIQ
jgi:sorbitol/mannitol transport system substrate-binding protein